MKSYKSITTPYGKTFHVGDIVRSIAKIDGPLVKIEAIKDSMHKGTLKEKSIPNKSVVIKLKGNRWARYLWKEKDNWIIVVKADIAKRAKQTEPEHAPLYDELEKSLGIQK